MKIKLALLLSIVTTLASAQDRQFTLEDLNFGGTNYRNMIPQNRYYEWWGDELVRTDYDRCSVVDKKNARETTLFTLDEINACINDTANRVYHLYQVSFPYPGKTVARVYGSKGARLIDWKAAKVIAGGHAGDHDRELEWCSASQAAVWLKDHNLYVEYQDRIRQLTTDGSREIVYGQSVHRDEFGIHKGTFWSPDGLKLAFYRMDQSMVADYPQVNIDTRIATLEPDKYPMAGETSHRVTVGVYDLVTQKTVYLQAGDPTDRYFTNVAWSPDSKTVYMFELNRDQNDCRLVSYDAVTGKKTAELYREQHPKYVEPQNPIAFLPWDDSKFVMQSQKDGYNHLYLFNKDGRQLKQLTKGEWVVIEMLGFNEKNKSLVFLSNMVSPIQKNIFEVQVNNGKMTRLDNGKGYHEAMLSKSGSWSLDMFSEPDVPRKIGVIDNCSAKAKELFVSPNPWAGYKVPEFSCGTIKAADGVTDLYYRMVKPVDFDASRKYPTVVYVYGGPHAHNVDARWNYGSRGWETYMAQKGYLLFILDNRGSENRGTAFEQATFRQLGQVEMQDQMKGVEFLKSLPYVDADRIGVHGWSFGGFMTVSLMTNYPDVFKVGVAGGPVIDWKWYEVMYGERYMDTPLSNPEGYEKASLIKKAKNLKGKLQIIQGMNDPTVVPQHCLQFLHECNIVGTQPDFYVYPGEGHNMRGHQSTHLHERITQYFEDYLK
ncbi:MAG: S9 family peptidase [Prevotella sp.]|nr:S9 family peptidase [Prevotella sp.]MDY2633440.1 DPP IV N-terminal domain-containing protein [Prevotella sp.]